MRYLGLDVSSVATGVSVIDQRADGSLELIFSDIIVTKSTWTMGRRLLTYAEALQTLLDRFQPDIVVKEGSFSNGFIKATQVLFKFNGVTELMCAQYGIAKLPEVQPTTIKKNIAGHGRASKLDVAEGLLQYINLDLSTLNEDQTDSIGAVLTYIKLYGMLSPLTSIAEANEQGRLQDELIKELAGNDEGK